MASQPSDYNKTAIHYNARYQNTQFEKYEIMLAKLKLAGKILDLGCGTGLLSEFLRRDDLIGCDSSKEMLKIRGSGDLCAIEKLPYKKDGFDWVLSFSVLMNSQDPEKALKEVKRILKKDGTFICTFLRVFSPKLRPLIEKHFKIKEENLCGEDMGFILEQIA
jgi:ubiquinone/menaquinone biosynthesis C-methylase UbiE